MSACTGAIHTEKDDEAKFWGAWAAVLLGDRQAALRALRDIAESTSPYRDRAFRLAVQATGQAAAHGMLQDLATDPKTRRRLIQGSGIAGAPT